MQREDFMSALRARQLAVGRDIAAGLVEILDAALWFPLAVSEEMDQDTARIFVVKELEHQVVKSVHGHADWAAAAIVRSKRFGDRPFPVPGAAEAEAIAKAYDVRPPIVRYVARTLASLDAVPLLGAVKKGVLVPDKTALKEWATLYDWSERSETGRP
jgi:hypothetical protein